MADQLIYGNELHNDSGVPLYYQLVMIFKRYISSGTLKPGDLMPSELELCNKLSISRTTVRQAFAALEAEGLVVRQRGKGTFVSEPKLKRKLNTLYSFTDEMQHLGFTSESETLGFEVIQPTKDLVNRLQLTKEEPIYKIVRLRRVNGEPLMLETVFVPMHICPSLTRSNLNNNSLYQTIHEHTGLKPASASETYEATVIDKNEASLLNTRAGSGAFFVQRVSKNETGEIFELALLLVRGDRCKYEVDLKHDNVSFLRKLDDE